MRRAVVFTGYRRVEYFRQSLASWSQARGQDGWDFFFHLEPSARLDQMKEAISDFFPRSRTTVNPRRLGVLENPYRALNSAFSAGYEFAVLAEDDIVVSDDVLEFFEWALPLHRTYPRTLVVNAWSDHVDPGDDPGFASRVMFGGRFSPLVWGTWKSRWDSYIEPTWDHDYSTGTPDGHQAGWDWNLNRVIEKNEFLVARCQLSRSDHIGEFGGTHMLPANFSASQSPSFNPHVPSGPFYLVAPDA